jgi:hypothetical protein
VRQRGGAMGDSSSDSSSDDYELMDTSAWLKQTREDKWPVHGSVQRSRVVQTAAVASVRRQAPDDEDGVSVLSKGKGGRAGANKKANKVVRERKRKKTATSVNQVTVKASLQVVSRDLCGVELSDSTSHAVLTKNRATAAKVQKRYGQLFKAKPLQTIEANFFQTEEGETGKDREEKEEEEEEKQTSSSSSFFDIVRQDLLDNLLRRVPGFCIKAEHGDVMCVPMAQHDALVEQLNAYRFAGQRMHIKVDMEICRVDPAVYAALYGHATCSVSRFSSSSSSSSSSSPSFFYHFHPVDPHSGRFQSCTERKCTHDLERISYDTDIQPQLPISLVCALYDFQKESSVFAARRHGRILLADDMGLGKTIQAITIACMYKEEWPVLVVCPSSLRANWKKEFLKWVPWLKPENVRLLMSASEPLLPTHPSAAPTSVVVISYDLIHRYEELQTVRTKAMVAVDKAMHEQMTSRPRQPTWSCTEMMEATGSPLTYAASQFRVVITDESHYIKTHTARRSSATVPVLHAAPRVIMLTGTPALSRPIELWSQLNALQPDMFGDYDQFAYRYCDAKAGRWGQYSKGAQKLVQLYLLLSKLVMLRRLKHAVLQLLPKHRSAVFFDPNAEDSAVARLAYLMETHKDALRSAMGGGGETKSHSPAKTSSSSTGGAEDALTAVSAKKQLMQIYEETGRVKSTGVQIHVARLLAQDAEVQVIVFAHHKSTLNAMEDFCKRTHVKYFRLDGSTHAELRQGYVDMFQADHSCRVAIISILAGGTGLTLTNATRIVFAELCWTPALLFQAEDRAHRLGQTKRVNIDYIVCKHTLDDLMWPMIANKLRVTSSALNGGQPEQLRFAQSYQLK